MLDICANDKHLATSLDPKAIRSAGMVMPLSGNHSFNIVHGGEMLAGIRDLQELEICPHVIQLDREILGLHLNLENLPQVVECLVPAERARVDVLTWAKHRQQQR